MQRSRASLFHSFVVLGIVLAGMLVIRAAHPVSALNPINEFTLPTPERFPLGITAGSDGNLWFVEYASGTIGRITPTGILTEFPLVPATPSPTCAASLLGLMAISGSRILGTVELAG